MNTVRVSATVVPHSEDGGIRTDWSLRLTLEFLGMQASVDIPAAQINGYTKAVPLLELAKPVSAKRQRRDSMKQEEGVAAQVGGRRQRGSGAVSFRKGDVRREGEYRIECKYTTTQSYSVKRSDLEKAWQECSPGELPIFVVDFNNRKTRVQEERWYMIPQQLWEKLCRRG